MLHQHKHYTRENATPDDPKTDHQSHVNKSCVASSKRIQLND